jgi:hypothetical protein
MPAVMVPTHAGNIPMKHTDPNFWKYVVAYVLLGAGSIPLIGEIVEWGIMGKRLALMGSFVAIWLGVLTLIAIKKSKNQSAK